jgi:hypothetical protein
LPRDAGGSASAAAPSSAAPSAFSQENPMFAAAGGPGGPGGSGGSYGSGGSRSAAEGPGSGVDGTGSAAVGPGSAQPLPAALPPGFAQRISRSGQTYFLVPKGWGVRTAASGSSILAQQV